MKCEHNRSGHCGVCETQKRIDAASAPVQAPQGAETCVCGSPETPNVTHRKDGPCFHEDTHQDIHPAAPVPPLQGAEMTDAEIVAIATKAHADGKLSWLGFEKDADDRYTVPSLSLCHFQLVRAVMAASGEQAASPTVEQAITTLVSALADSKGWMRDYADAIVRDAIDRRGGEGEKAKRRCILGCEFLRGENICRSCGNAAKGDGS